LNEKQLLLAAWEQDAWLWAYDNKVRLSGNIPFDIKGHEYQVDMMRCTAKRQCAKKGAQTGSTELNVLKTLHGMIWGKYPKGTLYLFPTREDVTDFSKGRFAPLISDNPSIGMHVKDTDAANIKRVKNSMLYLRGARSTQKIEGAKKSSSQLKSVPVDRLVVDEVDEMDWDMVVLALERMSHSEIQEESYLSTPTIPDYGIDKLYNESDQRVWMIKCDHCNHYTCLELEFPNCLRSREDGNAYRACTRCGKEIYPCDGRWVAQYPEKEKDMVGGWISQLNSAFVSPTKILDMFNNPPNGRLEEVYNSKLGMAYIAAENRLTINDIYSLCGQEVMKTQFHGPCAMGVDVGKDLHVVVGYKSHNGVANLIYMARISSFNDLHDIAKRYNVSSAVIDVEPETRAAREFQNAERFETYLCDYSDTQVKQPVWDDKTNIVRVNRTEICDATHVMVTTPGKMVIPRRCPEVDQFAKEMINVAKVLVEDDETGAKVYRYRKLGVDHYRHAMNYFHLAFNRINPAQKIDPRTKKPWRGLVRSAMSI